MTMNGSDSGAGRAGRHTADRGVVAAPTPETSVSGSASEQASGTEQLREEIAQTREELGATVEALAAKADVKARARETAQQAKAKAAAQGRELQHMTGEALRQAPEKARRLTARAREISTRADARWLARSPGVLAASAAGVAGAAGVAVWVWRRRRAQMTGWQRVVQAAQQTTGRFQERLSEELPGQLRGKAAEWAATAGNSEAAAQAAARGKAVGAYLGSRARQIAADPDTRPRLQGALSATAVLLTLAWLGRRARRHRPG